MTNKSIETTETFWRGRRTPAIKKLATATVSWGFTESDVVNANIAANKIYYDCYNGGGCNLSREMGYGERNYSQLEEYVELILKANVGTKFGPINLNSMPETILGHLLKRDENGVYVELELFFEELTNALAEENLDFPVYKLWHLHAENLMTLNPETANTDEWSLMTFGLESERAGYLKGNSRTLID